MNLGFPQSAEACGSAISLRVINLQNPDIRLETTPELWNRTLTVTFSNDTPEAMAELICLALDLKKTRQDNMILLFN